MVLTPQNVANSPITSYPVAKFTAVVDGKTVEIQGVALVDSSGNEYNTGNPLPTTGGGGGGGDVNLFDGEGNAITSHLATDKRGIDVTLIDSVGGYPLTSHSLGSNIALDTVLLNGSTGETIGDARPMPVTIISASSVYIDYPAYGTFGLNTGDTFTAPGNGSTTDVGNGFKYYSLMVKETGTVTSWTVVFEVSLDGGVNFTPVLTHTKVDNGSGIIVSSSAFVATCYRVRCSALTLGGGTNIKVCYAATY